MQGSKLCVPAKEKVSLRALPEEKERDRTQVRHWMW